MSSQITRKKNPKHKYILRLHEARITNSKYKIDKKHKNLHIEAEKYWNKAEYEKYESKKYWSYSVDALVHGISQDEMYRKYCLSDSIVGDETNVRISNTLIICLGETGKGKSYTLFGLNETYENRGFVLRILSTVFQLKTIYNFCGIDIYISAIEVIDCHCYDILESPKVIKNNRGEYKKLLVESEEYAIDLINQIDSTRNSEKTKQGDDVQHTSTLVLQLSIETLCKDRPFKSVANIFLIDFEAFNRPRADNMKTMDIITRKFLEIRNFSTSLVKVIGTSDSADENVAKVKSLMCLMKAMQNFIVSHTFDDMPVFTEHNNPDFLKTHFENGIDEMNGIIKMTQDRRVKNRNSHVVRETFDLMKRLLLAYIDDKIGLVSILNMNVAPDIPFMYRVCLNVFEPLKADLENEMAELERQITLDFMKPDASLSHELEEVESAHEIEQESGKGIKNGSIRLPTELRDECLLKMEPFNVVWEEFLKTKPSLKYTLDFYLKDLNTMENKLDQIEHNILSNEKLVGSLKEQEREDLMSESKTLETQIALTRKKIIQTQYDYQTNFNEFCIENDYVALPGDIDDKEDENKSFSVAMNPCSKRRREDLKNVNLESFSHYLDQIIRNSELATIIGIHKIKESQNKLLQN